MFSIAEEHKYRVYWNPDTATWDGKSLEVGKFRPGTDLIPREDIYNET